LANVVSAPCWQNAIAAIVYASPTTVGQTLHIGVGDAFSSGNGGVEVLGAATGN